MAFKELYAFTVDEEKEVEKSILNWCNTDFLFENNSKKIESLFEFIN